MIFLYQLAQARPTMFYILIGASLSEPHTNVTALRDACVCMYVVLNTFTSFDAPSLDVCGWSMIAHARHLHDRLSRTH